MNKKDSEKRLGTMMRSYGYFTHKWRDRGYISCPHCHRLVMRCPNCHGDLLLPKAQTLPDFLVAPVYTYIECKQAEESWSLTDFTENQEKLLAEEPHSWLFLLIGPGPAPRKQQAYLINWLSFTHKRNAADIKSVRFEESPRSRAPLAITLFNNAVLEWEKGEGWKIPMGHLWWSLYA